MTQYVSHVSCSFLYLCLFVTDKLKDFIKGEQLKFKDGSSKLLSGNKFQDRYLVLQDKKLLLYKDIKVRLSLAILIVCNCNFLHSKIIFRV